jgi:FixJ family two-component response regulator
MPPVVSPRSGATRATGTRGHLNDTRQLIAILDDDESVRQAIERLLRAAGLAVECFAAGEDFLASLQQYEPACLVLDLHMPGMNGFEVQAELAKSGRHVPVVVITGQDTPETQRRAIEGGAAAYFRKPVAGRALLAAIAAAIQAQKEKP